MAGIDPNQRSLTGLPVVGVVPLSQMVGEDDEDTRLLQKMADDAKAYLTSFPWCGRIVDFYFGDGVGGIIGIFFAHIQPSRPEVDEWLWVIVGDLPPAYLVIDECEAPKDAAEAYIYQMRRWVAAAKLGKTSEDIIPVNVPAAPEWAERLEKRLNTLENDLLPVWFSGK